MSNAKRQRMKQKIQEKEEAIAASELDSAKKKDSLSDSDRKSNDEVIDNSPAACRAAKRKAIMDCWVEKTRRRLEKEKEMDRLVETPVEVGPPKNQQVITHFFAREEALERTKQYYLGSNARPRASTGIPR